MKSNKLYAYLDITSAYELNKGNMNLVGQFYVKHSFEKIKGVLDEGRRYIHLMELPELLKAIDCLRNLNMLIDGSGGLICEFDVSNRVYKKGVDGQTNYASLYKGLNSEAVRERIFKGSDLVNCFNGHFIYDRDCKIGEDEIERLFRNQNLHSSDAESQPGNI